MINPVEKQNAQRCSAENNAILLQQTQAALNGGNNVLVNPPSSGGAPSQTNPSDTGVNPILQALNTARQQAMQQQRAAAGADLVKGLPKNEAGTIPQLVGGLSDAPAAPPAAIGDVDPF